MELERLAVGKQAPIDADCIRLEEQAGSAWKLTASALCVGDDDEGTSVSIVDAPDFTSLADAEAAGLGWAADVGVAKLMVTVATLE